jgi:ferredoxin
MSQSDGAGAESPWVVGESVPWSVAWSGEMGFSLGPSTDFPGMTELVQEEKPGAGRPMFAVNHVTRNRLGLFRHLCHVCGQPTKSWDRWLFPLQTGGMVALADGQQRYGGNVPPVHKACAERAQRQCPHLSRQFAQPVRFPKEDEGRMIQRTDIVPGMEAIAEKLPKGVPIVLSCYRLHGARFSKLVAKLRDEAGVAG